MSAALALDQIRYSICRITALERQGRRRFERLLSIARWAFGRIDQLETELAHVRAERDALLKARRAAQDAPREAGSASPARGWLGGPGPRGDA
jgi:hypothetical protein